MASNKDILDAQRFNRQRLVTSFVSGAPGGKELEPGKPWRGVVGGLVIVGLIFVGGFVSRWLAPGTPEGWEDGSLVVVEEDGSRYVTSEGVMYPVRNTASARLLLGNAEMTVRTLSADEVAGVERGQTVGIVDAPDSLPEPEDLVNDAWLSCVAPSGATWTSIGRPTVEEEDGEDTQVAAVPAEDEVSVVRVEGALYVVAGTHSHAVAADQENAVLRALGLAGTEIPDTGAAWLNLFTQGDPLEPLATPGAGDPMAEPLPNHPDLMAGQVVEISSGAAAGEMYVLGTDDELHPLSAVGYAMYELGDGAHLGGAVEVGAADLGQMPTTEPADPATWPDEISAAVTDTEGASPCVQLVADAMDDSQSAVLVAATGVPAVTAGTVQVEGGAGALVAGSGGGLLSADFFIDETGRAYPLMGERGATLELLGYSTDDVGDVPMDWVRLFPQGPELEQLDLPGPAETESESASEDPGSESAS